MGRRDEQHSTSAREEGAVLRCGHPKRWNNGIVKAGAEKYVIDEGPCAETKQTRGQDDETLCWYVLYSECMLVA